MMLSVITKQWKRIKNEFAFGETSSPETEKTAGVEKSKRLLSIDALRGFDMLLISGGALFIELMEGKTEYTWVDWMARQMTHPAWNGFTFYDFIFPLFLFIAGVALPFSINKGLSIGMDKQVLYRKSFRRMLILIGLGILYKNAPVPIFEPSQIRFVSVLGRIGIAAFLTTILYLNFSWKGRIYWITAILILYYAALFLIPVPGYGAGDLSFEGNLVGWIDRQLLPGRLLQGSYDELGLLTQFPALCLTVMGSLSGDLLRSNRNENNKLLLLFGGGVACIIIALIWSAHFPINKHLWTSSYILLTGGMAYLFVFVFYGLIEVLNYRRWAFFFQVIGLNSLAIYLGYRFINFGYSSELLFSGIYSFTPEPWHEVFEAFGAMILVWLVLFFLYRNKIFVKV